MIKITTLIKSTKKGDVEINVLSSEIDFYLADKRFRMKNPEPETEPETEPEMDTGKGKGKD